MPLYDIRCTSCGHISVDEFLPMMADVPLCACGGSREKYHGGKAANIHQFKEGFYEHLSTNPLYFSSKKSLRKYCRENNLTMDYVE